MLDTSQTQRLFGMKGIVTPALYEKALADSDPEKKITKAVRLLIAQRCAAYNFASRAGAKDDAAATLDDLTFIFSLPLSRSLYLTSKQYHDIYTTGGASALIRLYEEGVRIDPALFEQNDRDESAAMENLLFKWQKTQDLAEDEYYLEPGFWTRAQTTAMIEQPEKYAPDDIGARTVFFSNDNIFWRAARAGEFCKVIDIYRREEKPFPVDVLYAQQQENGIGFLTLLLFKKEPQVFEKLLDPVLWRGQAEDFKAIWHRHFPKGLQDRFPIEYMMQVFQNDTARRAMQGGHMTCLRRRDRSLNR